MPNKLSSGFTLIEILVVIVLIASMAAFFIGTFPNSLKRGRDARRAADLKQYQTVLESYANKNSGLYPARVTDTRADTTLCSDLTLTGCAADPSITGNYLYQSNGSSGATATQYVLWAQLEIPSSPITYQVYCSNGKAGTLSSGIPPSGGGCPLP